MATLGLRGRVAIAGAAAFCSVSGPGLSATPPQPRAEVVSFRELAGRMTSAIAAMDLAHLEPGYLAMCERHGLDPEASGLRDDYRRARVMFEATRDGGFFRLRWAVTDREPHSKEIWKAWSKHGFATEGAPSATAECDELSTLFAFLGRSVGVRKLGVFYPTWNHAIAAWEPVAKDGKPARILIPTSQIFLECENSFDQTTFSPKAQRRVFEYTMPDVRPGDTVPKSVADGLVSQLVTYGAASEDTNALLRLHRAERFVSSVGDCRSTRDTLVKRLGAAALSDADTRALAAYGRSELGLHALRPPEILLRLR